MKKLLFLFLVQSFILFAFTQLSNQDIKPIPPQGGNLPPPPKTPKPKPPPRWECYFYFYDSNGKTLYSETLDEFDLADYRRSLSMSRDNKIAEFDWKGTRCNCWVVLYSAKFFQGYNMGFWTPKNDGSYDLSNFNYYDEDDMEWDRWDQSVSSYSIYCN